MTFKEKVAKIDILGAVLLICAIVCLLLALQWGGTQDPWGSSKIWGLFLGFGLIIICFIIVQFRRGDDATIPPRIFLRQRTVLAGSIFACLLAMGLYTHIYYLPFYFQGVKGTSAEQSVHSRELLRKTQKAIPNLESGEEGASHAPMERIRASRTAEH